MARIIIPTPLRKFTQDQSTFFTSKRTVSEAIDELSSAYPDVKRNLFDENNKIRSFIKIFVGDTAFQFAEGNDVELKEDTVISIIPAIAGGSI